MKWGYNIGDEYDYVLTSGITRKATVIRKSRDGIVISYKTKKTTRCIFIPRRDIKWKTKKNLKSY